MHWHTLTYSQRRYGHFWSIFFLTLHLQLRDFDRFPYFPYAALQVPGSAQLHLTRRHWAHWSIRREYCTEDTQDTQGLFQPSFWRTSCPLKQQTERIFLGSQKNCWTSLEAASVRRLEGVDAQMRGTMYLAFPCIYFLALFGKITSDMISDMLFWS